MPVERLGNNGGTTMVWASGGSVIGVLVDIWLCGGTWVGSWVFGVWLAVIGAGKKGSWRCVIGVKKGDV